MVLYKKITLTEVRNYGTIGSNEEVEIQYLHIPWQRSWRVCGIVAKELETELVINSTSSVFSKEAFTSIAQEGFDGMVSTLFPGELS